MYSHTWKKYLPVIRLLMKKSGVAEQVVKLNRIDFETNNRLRKPQCSFSVEVIGGRIRTVNPAVPAKDLLESLQEDDAAKKLLRTHNYAFSLNSDFQLTIRQTSEVSVPTESE